MTAKPDLHPDKTTLKKLYRFNFRGQIHELEEHELRLLRDMIDEVLGNDRSLPEDPWKNVKITRPSNDFSYVPQAPAKGICWADTV
jgi:hypothetical protein